MVMYGGLRIVDHRLAGRGRLEYILPAPGIRSVRSLTGPVMSRTSILGFLFAATILTAACSLDDFRSPDRRRTPAGTLTFAPSLAVDLPAMRQEPSGLYWQSRGVGQGPEARPGDTVTVAFAGWLPDGRLFDRSPPGSPFTFILGRGQVIDGWEEGVAGMQEGGRRLLVLPPSLAYGSQGQGMIQPGATLVFDVQLLHLGRATPATPSAP
jgi:hypothetical protein